MTAGPDGVLDCLVGLADRVRAAVGALGAAAQPGPQPGQYLVDTFADTWLVRELLDAGFGVLSEESGPQAEDRAIVVIVDPIDGSENAIRNLPWSAISLSAVDRRGPVASVVASLAGPVFTAMRERGAWRDGDPICSSTVQEATDAFVILSGLAARPARVGTARAFACASLSLCAVACGSADGYVDLEDAVHGPWDYMAGMHVCIEAGAHVADAYGRDLITRQWARCRSPLAAGTATLLRQLLAERERCRA